LRVRPRHAAAGALAVCATLSVTAAALAHPPGSTAAVKPAPGAASSTAAAHAPDVATATPVAAAGPLATPSLALKDRHLRYGQHVVASGHAATRSVELQFRPAGERRWRPLRAGRVDKGRYALDALVRSTGAVRVVSEQSPGGAAAVEAAVATSRTEHVAVAAHLIVKRRSQTAGTGQAVRLAGVLLPRGRGHRVTVEGRVGGHWHTLSHARTRGNGHFSARVVARALGAMPLRVRSERTQAFDAARAAAGSIAGLRPSTASWYGDYGGPLACGGTLGYGTMGVANKALPCGTMVTIRYGGRQVRVPVIDRGPYVAGRDWDLTGATARALGFGGVGTVWVDR
jgi:hypothetical protein